MPRQEIYAKLIVDPTDRTAFIKVSVVELSGPNQADPLYAVVRVFESSSMPGQKARHTLFLTDNREEAVEEAVRLAGKSFKHLYRRPGTVWNDRRDDSDRSDLES